METIVSNDLNTAISLLNQGEVVAIPTETVYGLAANALDTNAILRIFEAKQRPHFNPLIVHCKSWESAQNYVLKVPSIAHELAKYFCPGALSFLLNKNNIIPDLISAGSPLVAIRIPQHPIAQALLQSLDYPLAAPSANEFGYISPTSAEHVFDSLKGKIPYILDGGSTQVGIESTIIGFSENGSILLYRKGGVSIESIEKVSGTKVINADIGDKLKPQSSGQLKSHYAPKTSLILGDIEHLYSLNKNKRIGLLSLSNSYSHLNFDYRFLLSQNHDLNEAAKNLFAFLRQLDQLDIDIILAEYMPQQGLGIAINDRLYRAQSIFKIID